MLLITPSRALFVAIATLKKLSPVFATFNPLHHSGASSPYFDAPLQFGVDGNTPDGCVVDQAAYIVRHGRYPEPGSFAGWQSLFEKFQGASYTASGPLAFIPTWTPPIDDPPHQPLFLSSTGSLEAFELGVQLRKQYGLTSGSNNFTVWSAAQQRVVDTAAFFLQGYLSQGNYLDNTTENRGFVVSLPDSVNFTFANSLTPTNACPPFSTGDRSALATTFRATYQSGIADRLNQFLEGDLQLNATDIGPMQDLCGFQTEVSGNSKFCNVFQENEWLDYEYALDLNYYYGSGPGNPFSAVNGFPWLQAVTDLFSVGPNKTTSHGTFVPPPLLMSFTHDNDLPIIISALGIWNDSTVSPLSLTSPDTRRQFHSSHIVSFRGYVALERLSCEAPLGNSVKHKKGHIVTTPGKSPLAKKFVRIRINNAPTPLPGCTSGPGSSCPLSNFIKFVQNRGKEIGTFVDVCGLQNIKNATSDFTAFVNPPPDSILSVPQALIVA